MPDGGDVPVRRFALDAVLLLGTIERLEQRIVARFPGAGLGAACGQLKLIARNAEARAAAIAAPNQPLRWLIFGVAGLGVALLGLLIMLLVSVLRGGLAADLAGAVQGVDAAFNIALLLGAALIFLIGLEARQKRGLALADVHELRALVHVIDMHQLTKDPSATVLAGPATSASPERTMSPFELMRYLDYCSEMLALSGKVAALYGHSSRDAVVIATVNELEQLAANMSIKIWHKIGIITVSAQAAPGGASTKSIGQ
jgi:hypothetical protein